LPNLWLGMLALRKALAKPERLFEDQNGVEWGAQEKILLYPTNSTSQAIGNLFRFGLV
jgi:hypothetical protein